jgi:hypothetical protein
MEGTEYELGGVDRLKNCRAGSFEDISRIVHLVLAILTVLDDGVMTAQRGVARARWLPRAAARDRKVGSVSKISKETTS